MAPFSFPASDAFERIALCMNSRNSPRFSNIAHICDLSKCNSYNHLGMIDALKIEPLFRVANAESIASYWYNGRNPTLLVEVDPHA
jgi:hypothetical protein